MVARAQADGDGGAGGHIRVTVHRVVAALIAQGDQVGGRWGKADVVAARQQVGKEVVAGGVGGLRALADPGVPICLNSSTVTPGTPASPLSWMPLRVLIQPHKVANAAQVGVAKIAAGHRLVRQGDAVRGRRRG